MSVSAFPHGAMAATPQPPGTVTLSGATIFFSDDTAGWYARASFYLDVSSGNTYKYEGISTSPTFPGDYTQINSTNDWLRGGSDDGNFQIQVQVTNDSLDTFTINGSSKSAGTTWYDLDGDVLLSNVETFQFQTDSSTVDIAIRYLGGSTLDSGTYTITAACDL